MYYVFPSANHTRFEHSFGVMHIAGKIFDACKENFATGDKKNQKYNDSKPSSFFDLRKLNENEKIYYQELRIAALLHDIGHGPLSHLFDSFLMDREKFFKLITENDILKDYEKSFEAICSEKVEHEHISCVFVFKILSDLKIANTDNDKKFSDSAKEMLETISIERVVQLIEPKFILKNKGFLDNDGYDYTNFFSRIITAFPIDSDRMDYLLRDSYFSGVNYGFYDINRIFASFMATQDKNYINLTFKGSGIDSMLRFIQSRTHLYNQVYFHKTNRAANTMLEAATRTNKGKTKLLNSKNNIEELERFYVINSDELFINETVKNDISTAGIEQEILEELKSRKLFKRVYEHKIILTPSSFHKKNIIKEIVKEIGIKLKNLESDSIFSYVDMYINEAFKDSDNDKAIKIATKDRSTGTYDTKKEWQNLNQEFINSHINAYMVRVYIRRTFKNSDDFKSMRTIITDLIKCECEKLEILE